MSAALLLLGPLERALPLLSESLHDGEAMREGSMVGTVGAPGIGEEWGLLVWRLGADRCRDSLGLTTH